VQRGSDACRDHVNAATGVAGEGRAFGACCFAGKLRSPAPSTGRRWRTRPDFGASPYASPYAGPSRTPLAGWQCRSPWLCPSWGQSAANTAADWPPSGEWSGRAARCASRDWSIGASAPLGGPTVRAAYGGNLSRS